MTSGLEFGSASFPLHFTADGNSDRTSPLRTLLCGMTPRLNDQRPHQLGINLRDINAQAYLSVRSLDLPDVHQASSHVVDGAGWTGFGRPRLLISIVLQSRRVAFERTVACGPSRSWVVRRWYGRQWRSACPRCRGGFSGVLTMAFSGGGR